MSVRVRIRGAGVVCSLGVGATTVVAAVNSGSTSVAFHRPSESQAAYPAPFDGRRDLPRGLGRRLGRQLAMSLAAVLEAVGDGPAWLETADDTGIVGATGHGPIDETVDFVAGVQKNGAKYASPMLFSSALHSSMAGVAARELGIRGPTQVVTNGDVSFETALLVASAGLATGRMRRAVVVGADAFHPMYARSLALFGMLADADEPLDPRMRRATHGVLLGEGAGALVLERDEGGTGGVWIEDVRLGADATRADLPKARIELMCTGDASSARRHADALSACGLADADVAYPAARFGAFSSLSAVAIAVEAARRLRATESSAPTLFVAAPHGADAAAVLISGYGGA